MICSATTLTGAVSENNRRAVMFFNNGTEFLLHTKLETLDHKLFLKKKKFLEYRILLHVF